MQKRFDVIVIGAGSGLEISSAAAQMGKKVAIVESGPFGGTCLNRGCIPSKMLIYSAEVAETIQRSKLFGIKSKITGLNWKQLVNRVNKFVGKEAREIEKGNKSAKNITVYNTEAKFIGRKLLQVGKDTITADKIFICAGARPSIPPIPGLKDVPYITSDEALRLQKQPKQLIIIGGGYIGAELAHFFGALGTKVTIIDRGDLLMKNEDSEIAQRFTEVYKRKHKVVLNANIKKVYKKGKNITVETSKGKFTGDKLLIATGRIPNSDILNVKTTGVKVNERGFVKVNEYLETSVPGIWAIGDIAGIYMFKHSANLEAIYAISNAFRTKVPVDYYAMPHAAFSSPQVAAVGKTEDELKAQKIPYRKSIYEYKHTGYGKAIEDNDGFVKVLINPKTTEILGCHIIGTDASILIHEVIVAMKSRLGITGITSAVHIHPALSEVVQRAFNQFWQ
ncbi:MAG TPA: dihydrolipoyl dehydrogenase [Candidatus Nanoarchaeia archaeon]|nr:dihydrolipoyl dehydrogenase [Candidatus Nanoarchaeia archaeon]